MSYLGTKDFFTEVEKGNIARHSMVHKFGRNGAVPNGSWQMVNLLGFTGFPLSAPTTVRIKAGGHFGDTAGGGGARSIIVQGIDSSFNESSEIIATAGAAASAPTTTSFWRVHRAWVSSVGTYGVTNANPVIVENSAGGTDLIAIAAGEGQSQDAIYTVPGGKTAYLKSVFVTVDSNKTTNIRCFTREAMDDTVAPMESKRLRLFWDGIQAPGLSYKPDGPEFALPEKSDIWFEAFGDGGVSQVTVDFELLLVDN